MSIPRPILQYYEDDQLTQREKVAEGTTSIVQSADLHGLKVAVKTLKPDNQIKDPLTKQRASADFESELAINATLRHPNIVLLIGCVCPTNTRLQSLVFEFCHGGVLRCQQYGPSKLISGLSVCIGIARALAFAHAVGIMHRDVKPSQVVFQGDVPKLADWGLAKFCKQDQCATGETGTWEFVSTR